MQGVGQNSRCPLHLTTRHMSCSKGLCQWQWKICCNPHVRSSQPVIHHLCSSLFESLFMNVHWYPPPTSPPNLRHFKWKNTKALEGLIILTWISSLLVCDLWYCVTAHVCWIPRTFPSNLRTFRQKYLNHIHVGRCTSHQWNEIWSIEEIWLSWNTTLLVRSWIKQLYYLHNVWDLTAAS